MKPTPCARRRSIAAASKPQSASAVAAAARRARAAGRARLPGVREKRGAGAGCVTPPTSTMRVARQRVRMPRRLGERQHRREAGVGAVEHARTIRRASSSRTPRRSAARNAGQPRAIVLRRQRLAGEAQALRAARRRTSARSRRPPRTCRRASRRCRTTARRSRARSSPRASLQRRAACMPQNIVVSSDAPSTIAASTTWPAARAPRLEQRAGDAEARAACRRRRSRRRG